MCSLNSSENDKGMDRKKGNPRLGTRRRPPNATLLSLTSSFSFLSLFLNACLILRRSSSRTNKFIKMMTIIGTMSAKTKFDRVLMEQGSWQFGLFCDFVLI